MAAPQVIRLDAGSSSATCSEREASPGRPGDPRYDRFVESLTSAIDGMGIATDILSDEKFLRQVFLEHVGAQLVSVSSSKDQDRPPRTSGGADHDKDVVEDRETRISAKIDEAVAVVLDRLLDGTMPVQGPETEDEQADIVKGEDVVVSTDEAIKNKEGPRPVAAVVGAMVEEAAAAAAVGTNEENSSHKKVSDDGDHFAGEDELDAMDRLSTVDRTVPDCRSQSENAPARPSLVPPPPNLPPTLPDMSRLPKLNGPAPLPLLPALPAAPSLPLAGGPQGQGAVLGTLYSSQQTNPAGAPVPAYAQEHHITQQMIPAEPRPAYAQQQQMNPAGAPVPAFAQQQQMNGAPVPAYAQQQKMNGAPVPAYAQQQQMNPAGAAPVPAYAQQQQMLNPAGAAPVPAYAQQQQMNPAGAAPVPAYAQQQQMIPAGAPGPAYVQQEHQQMIPAGAPGVVPAYVQQQQMNPAGAPPVPAYAQQGHRPTQPMNPEAKEFSPSWLDRSSTEVESQPAAQQHNNMAHHQQQVQASAIQHGSVQPSWSPGYDFNPSPFAGVQAEEPPNFGTAWTPAAHPQYGDPLSPAVDMNCSAAFREFFPQEPTSFVDQPVTMSPAAHQEERLVTVMQPISVAPAASPNTPVNTMVLPVPQQEYTVTPVVPQQEYQQNDFSYPFGATTNIPPAEGGVNTMNLFVGAGQDARAPVHGPAGPAHAAPSSQTASTQSVQGQPTMQTASTQSVQVQPTMQTGPEGGGANAPPTPSPSAKKWRGWGKPDAEDSPPVPAAGGVVPQQHEGSGATVSSTDHQALPSNSFPQDAFPALGGGPPAPTTTSPRFPQEHSLPPWFAQEVLAPHGGEVLTNTQVRMRSRINPFTYDSTQSRQHLLQSYMNTFLFFPLDVPHVLT